MIEYTAEKFGIFPGEDCTKGFLKMAEELKNVEGEKLVVFRNGTYYFDSEKCKEIYKAITNTAGREEYPDKSRVNLHRVPMLFENIKDLVLDGGNSIFLIDGKVTNIVISECENIKLKNFTIRTKSPNIHKFTVEKVTPFKAVFSLDKGSIYTKENGKYYFKGKGYKYGFLEKANIGWWTTVTFPDDRDTAVRGGHPLRGAVSVRETGDHIFTVRYAVPRKFTEGQTFHVFDNLRSDVGIFAEESKNITIENVTQSFNYSLAFVAQCCENITIDGCIFAPDRESGLEICSIADFIQICMCKGKINVRNSYFEGAGDDAINVHGIHFKLKNIHENKSDAVFSHSQTWGFDPLKPGDEIEIINPSAMLCEGKNRIVSSFLKNDKTIELTLEAPVKKEFENCVIEDITMCPKLCYINNTVKRVVTRAVLYTSRGKCIIDGNHFVSNSMSGILLSDDAKSWYESGRCLDVTISNNTFDYCGETPVRILPENSEHRGAVHKNITIKDNYFVKYKGEWLFAKSTDDIFVSGNKLSGDTRIKTENCGNIESDV